MSETKIILAVSSLAAALADAGLFNVTITVGATAGAASTAPAETEKETTTGRRNRATTAAEKEQTAAEDTQEDTKQTETKGRGRGRGAAKKETADAGTESKGRGRGRGANKEAALINDDEDQAAMRANLTADLKVLAEHDEAIDDVTEALARVGATSIKTVATASLEAFDQDIADIFEKYDLN